MQCSELKLRPNNAFGNPLTHGGLTIYVSDIYIYILIMYICICIYIYIYCHFLYLSFLYLAETLIIMPSPRNRI